MSGEHDHPEFVSVAVFDVLAARVALLETAPDPDPEPEPEPDPDPDPEPDPDPDDPYAPTIAPSTAITISAIGELANVPEGSHVLIAPGTYSPSKLTVARLVSIYGEGKVTFDGEFTRDYALATSEGLIIDGIDATRYNGNGWSTGSSDRRAQGQAPFKGGTKNVTIRAYNGYNNRHSALRIEGAGWHVVGFKAWRNGQHALTGGGSGAVVEHFEWWENGNDVTGDIKFFATDRGGSKITYSTDMLLRHGVSHDHEDMGVWADGNNRRLTLVDVESRHNRKNGFNWEVNPGPITMIDCRGFDNGYDEPGNAAETHMRWCQVFISSSGGVTVDGGEYRGRKGVGVWNDWSHSAYDQPDWGDEIGSKAIKIIGATIEGSVIVAGVNVMGSPSKWDVNALARAEKWFEGNTFIGERFAFGGELISRAEWLALGMS